MSRVLQIILATGIVLGVVWTLIATAAQGAGGLAAVFWFFVTYALFAVFFVVAAWAFWKHPDERRRAGWIMALPIIFWFLPNVVRSLSGGVLTSSQLYGLAAIILVMATGACWLFPRRAASVVPRFLVRSGVFNWLVLLSVICGWAFLVAVIVFVANDKTSSSSGGMGLAYGIVLGAIYLVALGIASFGASTWAWISLRGGIETPTRKLNIAQLVVAMPGVLTGILVATWLAGQGIS